ncbi:ATP-binding cassette domain-containing protein [Mesoplasma corruscae]|uniref:ABC transporter ATP-binding protein/permease n=1 Tax=Mesoplasma corruscae TaxID=216874 RepID=A0A2S5RGU4_9MOLU|nr:ABC transporter ATP-binding protein [Mesoplasma corruscae]PPE06559.1 ABC transporter ATP-binding protein/permease [Mesoplasma corruscae]
MKKIILFKNHKGHLAIYITLSIIQNICVVLSTYSLGMVLKNAVPPISDFTKAGYLSLFTITLFLISAFCSYINTIVKTDLSKKIKIDLINIVILKIFSYNLQEFNENKKGEYLSWINNDVENIESGVYSLFLIFLDSFFSIVFTFIALAFISWIVLLITIFFSLLFIIVPYFMKKRITKNIINSSLSSADFISRTENLMNGYEEFYASNKSNILKTLITTTGLKYENVKQKQTLTINKLLLFMHSFIIFVKFAVIVAVIILSSSYEWIIKGGPLMVLSIEPLSYSFVIQFSNIITNLTSFFSHTELAKKFNVNNKEAKISKINFQNLKINNLKYSIENKQIINDLSFDIKKNEKILIIGESGAGKSTIFNILMKRVKDFSGQIYFNDNKKINYNEINDRSLFQFIDFLNQHPLFFNDTLKNNLTLFDDTIEENDILNALKKTNMFKWFEKNGSDLNMMINSENKNISSGEMQRLSLARVLLRNKDLLFLDEVTANLDIDNRRLIEEIILNSDKTILFISHSIEEENKLKFDKVIQI